MKLVDRLAVLGVVSVIGLAVLGMTALWTSHGQLLAAETRCVDDVVTSTGHAFEHFHGLESAGAIRLQEAQSQSLAVLRRLRFEGGNNYIFVYDARATTLL